MSRGDVRIGTKIVRDPVQIVVVGEPKTGKSTLIKTGQRGRFPKQQINYVLPNLLLPDDVVPYRAPVLVMDTDPSKELDTEQKLKLADVVIATFSWKDPETFYKLKEEWLPKLRELKKREKLKNKKVRVIVVGCMIDERDINHRLSQNFDITCEDLCNEYRIVQSCVGCSALKVLCVKGVFSYAARAVVCPLRPLYSWKRKYLSRPLVRALQRIFSECVEDDAAKELLEKDRHKSYITDVQFNTNIMAKLRGGAPLTPPKFRQMKRSIRDYLPGGVDSRGHITLLGFVFLHALYVLRSTYEMTWAVVTAFGYDYDLQHRASRYQHLFDDRFPDQSVELALKGKEFVRIFFEFSKPDEMGFLSAATVGHIFKTELKRMAHLKDDIELNVSGGLSLDGLLSLFELMACREPAETFATFVDLGYFGSPASALCITRERRFDRALNQSERNVYQCFVFGPKKGGKSALLNFSIGRTFSEDYTSTTTVRFATRVVPTETTKTLILREIPEEGVQSLLSDQNSLAACDAAVFVYNSSIEGSRERAHKMLMEVDMHQRNSPFGMFSNFLIAVGNMDSNETVIDSKFVIPIPPTHYEFNSGINTDIFLKIVMAAQNPPSLTADFRWSQTNINMDEDQGSGGTSFVDRQRSRSPLGGGTSFVGRERSRSPLGGRSRV